jgi:hypothetical protein
LREERFTILLAVIAVIRKNMQVTDILRVLQIHQYCRYANLAIKTPTQCRGHLFFSENNFSKIS